VLRLVPRPPKRDLHSFLQNDGKKLRFVAVLLPRPGCPPAEAALDAGRRHGLSVLLHE
jgi:hypothetical protein